MGGLPRRFRVRTLLILVLVVGVPLGLWKRARNEKLAVEAAYAALEQEDCIIDFAYAEPTVLGSLAEFLGIGYAKSSRVEFLGMDLDEPTANLLNLLPAIHEFDSPAYFESCQLEYLRPRPECEIVTICCGEANGDFSLVAEVFPNVRCLKLSGMRIADDDIAALSRIATLEELDLGPSEALPGGSYASLKRARSLRCLTVCELSAADVEVIAQLESLETLKIYRSDLEENSLMAIASLPKLEELHLTNCSIPLGSQLPQFSKLSTLDLSRSRFPADWIDEVSNLKNLSALVMGSCPVELTDLHAEQLLQVTDLSKLDLSGSTCSERFVVRLLDHPHLNELWLNKCEIKWEESTVWPEGTSIRTLYLWGVKLPPGKGGLIEKTFGRGHVSFSIDELFQCK